MEIKGFTGKYRYLSNYYLCEFYYHGACWPSSEHAYQAAKFTNPETRYKIYMVKTPNAAKKLGGTIKPIREDWEHIKIRIMYEIVLEKFKQNKKLKELLLDTGDAYLEETNTWNDLFWGKDPFGHGENHLGQCLMKVRSELARNTRY